jgi:hypothetical protein
VIAWLTLNRPSSRLKANARQGGGLDARHPAMLEAADALARRWV